MFVIVDNENNNTGRVLFLMVRQEFNIRFQNNILEHFFLSRDLLIELNSSFELNLLLLHLHFKL